MSSQASAAPNRLVDEIDQPVEAIREGFSYDFYEAFLAKLDVTEEQLAGVLSVSTRTLRRRRQKRQRLSRAESDRLWLVAQVFEQAAETFGTEARAQRWLAQPHRMLGGESPLQHLDTTAGADRVRYVLHQIDYSMPL